MSKTKSRGGKDSVPYAYFERKLSWLKREQGNYDEARELMDSFDLSGLPFVLKLDRDGTVLEKYVEF